MRIAQVAPLYEAVPPAAYGGTERVVAYLTEGLLRCGHDVTLFASGDSHTTARLVPTAERSLREQLSAEEIEIVSVPLHLAAIGAVCRQADAFDIIHCHLDYLSFAFAPLVRTPIVTTLHGRLDLPGLPAVFTRFPIDWPEPFGIVMIEALACGTPVLAMNCGAVREVLWHGVTGLLGDSMDDLVALAPRIGALDRHSCRREAERRFSTQAMAEGYEHIYARLIAGQL